MYMTQNFNHRVKDVQDKKQAKLVEKDLRILERDVKTRQEITKRLNERARFKEEIQKETVQEK